MIISKQRICQNLCLVCYCRVLFKQNQYIDGNKIDFQNVKIYALQFILYQLSVFATNARNVKQSYTCRGAVVGAGLQKWYIINIIILVPCPVDRTNQK